MTLLATILQNDTVKVLVLDNHKSFVDYITEPNTMIALSAIFISILGLSFTIIFSYTTIRMTKKHNYKSVLPVLMSHYNISNTNFTIKINIINCGLGTALIKKFNLIYKDKSYNNIDDLIKRNLTMPLVINCYQFPSIPTIVPISVNGKIDLLDIEFLDSNEYSRIIEVLQKTKYDIEYESMYEEKKTYENTII